MDLSRVGVVVGTVIFVLFCLGFGGGPSSLLFAPERVALIGLAAMGLVWPVVILGLIGRARRPDRSNS